MIGSHNTFTYLKSTSWLYNNCKKWWKCQKDDIKAQYMFGIRFFDIRVVRDGNKWRAAHGACKLKITWKSLDEICAYMGINCPDALYRIVLESGSQSDKNAFISEATNDSDFPADFLTATNPNLWRVDIKDTNNWMGSVCNNNKALYKRGYAFAKVNTWEKPAHELHGNITGRNFYKADLRKKAQEINASLDFFSDKRKLNNKLKSKKQLYFLDYCTNVY